MYLDCNNDTLAIVTLGNTSNRRIPVMPSSSLWRFRYLPIGLYSLKIRCPRDELDAPDISFPYSLYT